MSDTMWTQVPITERLSHLSTPTTVPSIWVRAQISNNQNEDCQLQSVIPIAVTSNSFHETKSQSLLGLLQSYPSLRQDDRLWLIEIQVHHSWVLSQMTKWFHRMNLNNNSSRLKNNLRTLWIFFSNVGWIFITAAASEPQASFKRRDSCTWLRSGNQKYYYPPKVGKII